MFNLNCNLCQKSLSYKKELEIFQSAVIWSCGHCFHAVCFKTAEVSNICPQCRIKGSPAQSIKKVAEVNAPMNYKERVRPDLEGHF